MTKAEIVKEGIKYAYAYFASKAKTGIYIKKKWWKALKHIPLIGRSVTHVNWLSTEFTMQKVYTEDKGYLMICICGSNDFWDWIHNANIGTYKGYKLSGYLSALRIKKAYDLIPKQLTQDIPILLGTHSKSGAVSWPLYDMLYNKDKVPFKHIYAFAPARGLRKKMSVPCATLYIDKNDPVPKLGITLNHPDCAIVYHPEKDPIGIDISDHSINHWDGVELS